MSKLQLSQSHWLRGKFQPCLQRPPAPSDMRSFHIWAERSYLQRQCYSVYCHDWTTRPQCCPYSQHQSPLANKTNLRLFLDKWVVWKIQELGELGSWESWGSWEDGRDGGVLVSRLSAKHTSPHIQIIFHCKSWSSCDAAIGARWKLDLKISQVDIKCEIKKKHLQISHDQDFALSRKLVRIGRENIESCRSDRSLCRDKSLWCLPSHK